MKVADNLMSLMSTLEATPYNNIFKATTTKVKNLIHRSILNIPYVEEKYSLSGFTFGVMVKPSNELILI